jgi:hypothetical protein
MAWLLDPQIWIAPPTLTALEIVLGHRLGEKRSCDQVCSCSSNLAPHCFIFRTARAE